jgi:membrane fusion protein, multidrug efflux system
MRNRVTVTGVALLAAGVALTGCGRAGAEDEGAQAEDRVRTLNVEVVEAVPRDFVHYVRVVGTVEADRDVTVSAEEGGTVQAVLARPGDRVRPGQPLARLDASVLRAQLEQAVSQAELAEETWQRQRQLWEEEQIGTEMAYLQAKYNARTARAQARVLAERVERTTIRAPIAGVLEERMVEVGTMVFPGTPVARILDVDTVKVVGGVPERYAADIAPGVEVVLTVDRLGGREFVGAVDHVGAAVDRSSRTFTVEIGVPNPGLPMKPGMVANIQIARQPVTDAIVVPRHAVLRSEGGYVAYVAVPARGGWQAEARTVVPGVARGDEMVIEAGIEAGDRVVVVGQQRVAHGDALVITNEAPPATRAESRAEEG